MAASPIVIHNADLETADQRRAIMDRYQEYPEPVKGQAPRGCKTLVTVEHDHIKVETTKNDVWVRTTVYDYTGDIEEIFVGMESDYTG